MPERKKGLLALLATCIIWGLSPIYYYAIDPLAPMTILAHRTIWSLVFFVLVLGGQRRLGQLPAVIFSRHWKTILLSSLLISTNWYLFIWSVRSGHMVEASLGYYIMPLVSICLGVLVLRERLTLLQWTAVGLALLAVTVLTIGLKVAPLIAIALAISFGTYGLLKKRLPVDPILSVAAEVAMLAPLAVLWFLWAGTGPAFGADTVQTLLLVGAGLMTAIPLILFSYSTQKVGLATLGIVSYLNPTIQFLSAVMIFAEPFTLWHIIAFGLIWLGLILYAITLARGAGPSRSHQGRLSRAASRL